MRVDELPADPPFQIVIDPTIPTDMRVWVYANGKYGQTRFYINQCITLDVNNPAAIAQREKQFARAVERTRDFATLYPFPETEADLKKIAQSPAIYLPAFCLDFQFNPSDVALFVYPDAQKVAAFHISLRAIIHEWGLQSSKQYFNEALAIAEIVGPQAHQIQFPEIRRGI